VDYQPTKGFFDLSHKPKNMTNALHKKIQNMQMDFIRESKKYRDPAVRENNRARFEELQNYTGELQQIIIQNWPQDELFGGTP
jgi:hypothetical protein